MHQVYDDEMTFKLVQAASTVSGLPVDQCLEAFGKHFLVYCQKNGYDQILRVLGSNLYDFLTNLDNLHDHLASIYPGMRAPSFRVTRHHNTNTGELKHSSAPGQVCAHEANQQQVVADELSRKNVSSSLTGSMYLHYYSERAGLSPIVKGLVMAVAKEFFHTDILVTECPLEQPQRMADDHVVLKIDSRTRPNESAPALAEACAALIPSAEWEPEKRDDKEPAGSLPLSILDSLSSNPKDSLVSSEMMMQSFPFHVIFDRDFKLVQVGASLLRATSAFWQRHSVTAPTQNGPHSCHGTNVISDDRYSAERVVKFGDLFRIVRPKIDFTFDAIADHTNQVFVVRTRPLVLNADFRRLKRLSSGSQSTLMSGSAAGSAQCSSQPKQAICPFERVRLAGAFEPSLSAASMIAPPDSPEPDTGHAPAGLQLQAEGDGEEAANHLSLRLKGQMIVLLAGELCLYLCSPRVDHLDQLMECGINMSDLALHDRARELMLMSHTHKEDREAVKKLDQASNDLKKMDTKLRQENKRTNEVLHNIFPAKIASLLSHGLKVESESFDLVTCLYSDIIGFTKMCGSENVRPIDIVRLLNTLYLQFDSLTNIHGVFKVETIGDAYVVVGGLPEPVGDHADRCVKMGLDMVKVIATVRSPADNQPIQMRIGIHSGPVMAGIVGIRVPRYSLFGNTTTLANQLETNGVGGKIHISDFTLRNLIKRDRFVVENNPNEISGIPFVTYFVTNYLGDQNETLKHEQILKEQLIKDFQLMGNELELVDDSYLVYGRSSGSCPPTEQNMAASLDEDEHSVSAPEASGAASLRPSKARPLAESLTNSDQEYHERLILMDIEDQAARKEKTTQLKQLSRELSSSILSEAIKQVSKTPAASVHPTKVLLWLRDFDQELELVYQPYRGPEHPMTTACPLCEGSGQIETPQDGALRLKFAKPATGPPTLPASSAAKLGALIEWLGGQLNETNGKLDRNQRPESSGRQPLAEGQSSASLASEPELQAKPTSNQVSRVRGFGWARPARPKSSPAGSGADRNAGLPRTGGSPLLSSTIERMKRMDTLKRRKLNKERQQQSVTSTSLQTPTYLNQARGAIAELNEDDDYPQADIDTHSHRTHQVEFSQACQPQTREERRSEQLAPPSGHSVKDIITGPERKSSSGYSYQSLRSALTNLIGDVTSSKTGKRFSLTNAFANIPSPFSSPIKFRTSKLEEKRKSTTSSHSHSSGSAGAQKASSKNPRETTTNCSCLRSASSQSISSLELK